MPCKLYLSDHMHGTGPEYSVRGGVLIFLVINVFCRGGGGAYGPPSRSNRVQLLLKGGLYRYFQGNILTCNFSGGSGSAHAPCGLDCCLF